MSQPHAPQEEASEKKDAEYSGNYKMINLFNRAADLVLLSVLWCLCSLPLVTLGAASAALYYAVVTSVRQDRTRAVQTFFSAFGGNLRQTLPVTLVTLAITAVSLWVGYYFFYDTDSMLSGVFVMFSAFMAALMLLIQMHAFALISRFHLSRRELITVIVKLSGQGMGKNLLCLLGLIAAIVVSIFYPPVLFITPAGFALFFSYMEEPRFPRYIRFEQ
jgi:uncharacterized membrane protein YesL